jgi:hypothetical protein
VINQTCDIDFPPAALLLLHPALLLCFRYDAKRAAQQLPPDRIRKRSAGGQSLRLNGKAQTLSGIRRSAIYDNAMTSGPGNSLGGSSQNIPIYYFVVPIVIEGSVSTPSSMCRTQNTSACKEMPGPVKEHELLQKFVGKWESEGEAFMAPGQPPTKLKGVESSRLIGGFWFVGQIKSTVPDFPYEQILTIGYDPAKKKYIGTVIDSMTSHLWQFEGTFDVTGNILTWETEGP